MPRPTKKDRVQLNNQMHLYDLPYGLKTRFKMACAKKNVTMKETLLRLMTQYSNEVFTS